MPSPLQGQTITLFSNPMFLDCGRDRPDYTDTRGRCKLRTAYPESICRESLSCSIFFWPLAPKPTACWEVTYSALWSQNHTCNPYAKKKGSLVYLFTISDHFLLPSAAYTGKLGNLLHEALSVGSQSCQLDAGLQRNTFRNVDLDMEKCIKSWFEAAPVAQNKSSTTAKGPVWSCKLKSDIIQPGKKKDATEEAKATRSIRISVGFGDIPRLLVHRTPGSHLFELGTFLNISKWVKQVESRWTQHQL